MPLPRNVLDVESVKGSVNPARANPINPLERDQKLKTTAHLREIFDQVISEKELETMSNGSLFKFQTLSQLLALINPKKPWGKRFRNRKVIYNEYPRWMLLLVPSENTIYVYGPYNPKVTV